MGQLSARLTLLGGKKRNTSYAERYHAADRLRNARKGRKTSQLSKYVTMHESMTHFTEDSDNSSWPVRMLRGQTKHSRYRQRTPATSVGLADHGSQAPARSASSCFSLLPFSCPDALVGYDSAIVAQSTFWWVVRRPG